MLTHLKNAMSNLSPDASKVGLLLAVGNGRLVLSLVDESAPLTNVPAKRKEQLHFNRRDRESLAFLTP